jgi:hypothetical protein
LSYCSFHNFHTSFKWIRISSRFSFFIFLISWCLLVVFWFLLKLFNIAIPDIPLRYFTSQMIGNWRTSGCSSLFYVRIYRLNLSVFEIEFISHCLLDGLYIFSWSGFLLFCLSSELLELGFSIVENLFLYLMLIWRGMDIVTF